MPKCMKPYVSCKTKVLQHDYKLHGSEEGFEDHKNGEDDLVPKRYYYVMQGTRVSSSDLTSLVNDSSSSSITSSVTVRGL